MDVGKKSRSCIRQQPPSSTLHFISFTEKQHAETSAPPDKQSKTRTKLFLLHAVPSVHPFSVKKITSSSNGNSILLLTSFESYMANIRTKVLKYWLNGVRSTQRN